MEQLELIIAIIVLGLYAVKLLGKSKKDDSGGEEDAGDEQAEEQVRQEVTEDGSGPVFAYYTGMGGRPRVDLKKSVELSGREITEFEVYTEQKRLDKIYARELEQAEGREESGWTQPEQPAKFLSAEEIIAAMGRGSGNGTREKEPERGDIIRTTRNSDSEYQIEQLDRWLEAGLIDKKEYRARKKKLEQKQ